MNTKIQKLADLAHKNIAEKKIEKLVKFSDLILEWNEKINLISRKDTENIFEQHLAPSMIYYLLDILTDEDNKIVDIGSGGGFPGIVNAILFPEKKFVFIDARQKKITVLSDIIEKLHLNNAQALWGRTEDLSKKKELKKSFDVCTSRGVGTMKKIIPMSLPFLKDEGIMLAMKGGDLREEFSEIKKPSRYTITEYETNEIFHYLERFKTLKIVELGKAERK
jgi:16S rRNA (guanine527-N7)-methyltransferase